MGGFTKLFSTLTDSTVWGESHATRIVWITMLAMANRKGNVLASVPGLANRARVTLEECERALSRFMAPDKYSRTADHDGRRIEPIDGGWHLLNYIKYREMRDEDARREYMREYMGEYRKQGELTGKQGKLTVSRSKPPLAQAEAEAEAKKKKQGVPPPSGAFLRFWASWPRHHRKGAQGECWDKWRKGDFDLLSEAILAHVESLKRGAWTEDGGKFIPAPLVYLNQRRWEGAEPEASTIKVDV